VTAATQSEFAARVADLAADRARERMDARILDEIRWCATAELLVEAEYFDRERQQLAAQRADGEITEEYAALVVSSYEYELRFVAAELERRAALAARGTSWLRAPSRFDAAFLRELKSRVDLAEFIAARGFALKRTGSKYVGLCPFHVERTPSFVVYAEHFCCFGCAASGDVFSFVQRLGADFPEAVKLVAAGAGVPLQSFPKTRSPVMHRIEVGS
jgi:hypothetical protein